MNDKTKEMPNNCDIVFCGALQKKVLYNKDCHLCMDFLPDTKECWTMRKPCPLEGHPSGRDD